MLTPRQKSATLRSPPILDADAVGGPLPTLEQRVDGEVLSTTQLVANVPLRFGSSTSQSPNMNSPATFLLWTS